MPVLLDLFLTFAKIGLFTFGGGYAMISVVEYHCVDHKKWITHEEMMDLTVIAESTPGPIAVNCATYTGYKRAGIRGALAATVGMILPSFVIIYTISKLLDQFLEITVIANAFQGIRIAVSILILDAAFRAMKKMKKKPLNKVILLCACLAMLMINALSLHFSSITLMLIAGIVSLSVFLVKENSSKKGGAL